MTELLSSNGWAAFAAFVIIQATLLLGAAALAAWSLRRRPAAERHLVWGIAVAAVLALPLLSLVAPWQVNVPVPGWNESTTVAAVPDQQATSSIASEATLLRPDETAALVTNSYAPAVQHGSVADGVSSAVTMAPRSAAGLLLVLWLAGTVAVCCLTLLAVVHLRLVARRAHELREPALVESVRRIGAELGIRRQVRLLEGDADAMPMTFGFLRPTLLLPSAARSWTPERQDSVLRHELAHIRRRDTLTQLVADIGFALYWFHPLMWVAARRLRIEREHACDDVVLASGLRPSTYAAALLEIARSTRTRPLAAPVAIAMAQPNRLRGRITAVLDERTRAERVRASLLVPCWIGALAFTACFAAMAPVPAGAGANPIVTFIADRSGSAETSVPSASQPLAGDGELPASAPVAMAEIEQFRESALRTDEPTCRHEGRTFSGSMTHVEKETGSVTRHILQTTINGLDLCIRTEYARSSSEGDLQFGELRPGDRRVLALESAGSRQTLEMTRTASGVEHAWFVDGAERPFDEAARQWRDAMLEVGEGHFAMSRIRGEEGQLRGEIGRIRGEQGRLRGEIGRIRGEEGRLRGEIGRIRGEEGRLRGEIGRIRGEEGRLRGEVGMLRGRIASLESARRATRDEQTRNRLDAEIAEARADLGRVEAQIAEFDAASRIRNVASVEGAATSQRIREVERRIEAFDAASRIREVEARIAEHDRSGEIPAIEARIQALESDRRIREIRERIEPHEARLREIHRRIR